ncbi:MAG: HPr family phosphocarrier protein [Burkholderiaceae bacterium]|jgi:phosphocarrier protein
MKVSGSAWLIHASGLHARPAIKLTKLAKRYQAAISVGVAAGGPWKDAKSIAQVLSMKVPARETLYFEAVGPDAAEAIDALVHLVDADFELNSAASQSGQDVDGSAT